MTADSPDVGPAPDGGFTSLVHALIAKVPIRVAYLLAGLALGGIWAMQVGPVWEHALRLAVVLLVGPPLLHLARTQLTTGVDRAHRPRLSLLRFSAFKAALVVAAMIATWLLDLALPHPELIAGIALAATIAVVGPILHPLMRIDPRVVPPSAAPSELGIDTADD